MRKLGVAIGLLLGVGLLVLLFAQRPIGERLFSLAVDRNAGVDRVATWPDGLHAYVCGSGSPMPDAQRAGPCIAVIAGQRAFIFDVGSGGVRKLQPLAFPMDRLDAVFLTHLHSDHFDGLGELLLQAWIAGQRDTRLPVYGPEGTERVIAGLMEAYTIDRGYRIAHHGPDVAKPDGFGADPRLIALEGGENKIVYQGNGVTIRAIEVDHRPIEPAFAYRIDYAGRSIVISGDTAAKEALTGFAEGSDVIFHEALNREMIGKIGRTLAARGNASGAKIMSDIQDYHTSPEEAAQIADKVGAKALVLYHLVPAPPASLMGKAFLGDAKDDFDGELQLAEDGMLVRLPSGGQAIEFDDQL